MLSVLLKVILFVIEHDGGPYIFNWFSKQRRPKRSRKSIGSMFTLVKQKHIAYSPVRTKDNN